MNNENIENYVISKGWKFTKNSSELIIFECPFCHDEKSHFYISQEHGAFNCKKCGKSGGFLNLKRLMGDLNIKTYQTTQITRRIKEPEIKKDPLTTAYLEKRNISSKIYDKFDVLRDDKRMSIGFVYRDPQGIPYLTKWRNIKTKDMFTEPSGQGYVYPFNIKDFNTDYILICEGEIDAMSWAEYGYESVISIPGANIFKSGWIEMLEKYKTIYLSLDMDLVGHQAMDKIIQKLGRHRCKKIILPFKDCNDCLKEGVERKEIEEIVNKAEVMRINTLKHVSDIVLHEADDRDYGETTGWGNLDQLTRWRTHELSIFTGDTKQGKTLFLLNAAKNQILNNQPVLVCPFEDGLDAAHKNICSMIMKKSYFEMNKEEIKFFNDMVKHLPLYYVESYGGMDLEILKDHIYFANKYYDVKYIMLDNLHFFAKMKNDNNLAFEIGQIMKEIKSWTMELDIHIWLVVHPTKLYNDKKPTENDLRGSSDIKQIANNVFRVCADKEASESEVTLLIARHVLATVGTCHYIFERGGLNYIENATC